MKTVPYSVTIKPVGNGFIVNTCDAWGDVKNTFVATSVKDSYSFGSVSLTKVLDELFNPAATIENEETI